MTHKEISHKDGRVEEINGLDRSIEILARKRKDAIHKLIGDRVARKVNSINDRIDKGECPTFALVTDIDFSKKRFGEYENPLNILGNTMGKSLSWMGYIAIAENFKGDTFVRYFNGEYFTGDPSGEGIHPQVRIPGDYSDINLTYFCIYHNIEEGPIVSFEHNEPKTTHACIDEPDFALATKLVTKTEANIMGIGGEESRLYFGASEIIRAMKTKIGEKDWKELEKKLRRG